MFIYFIHYDARTVSALGSQSEGLCKISFCKPFVPPDAGLWAEGRSTTEHFNTQPTDILHFSLLFVY